MLHLGLLAQQEPQFNQYMFNRTTINPASAGIEGAVCITGFGRNQWIGYKDEEGTAVNPRTYGIAFDMPIYKISSGAGINLNYGKTGAESNFDIKLLYSYQHVFKKKHLLSFGLNLDLLSKSIDYSLVKPSEYDPLIPGNTVESGFMTDLGFGIHYQASDKFYAGISATNLLGSSAEIGAPEFNLVRHYYLFSGYDFGIAARSSHDFVLTPGFLVKATTGSLNVDLNAILSYDEFLWGGLVYRLENAVGIMAGVDFNGLRLGISYDYTMSPGFAKGSRNSVEFFIKYCYPIYPPVIKKSGYNTRNL
jgi:type IX secretion system PorP/SprF family membrane protein